MTWLWIVSAIIGTVIACFVTAILVTCWITKTIFERHIKKISWEEELYRFMYNIKLDGRDLSNKLAEFVLETIEKKLCFWRFFNG